MMRSWETFKIVGGRGVYEKRVSLSSRGVLTLNQPTFDALGEPDRVELMFDRHARMIGLKPSSPDVTFAASVRKQGANKSYLINARPFCYHYKIEIPQTVRFRDIIIEDGVLVLDLKTATPVELKSGEAAARDLQGNSESEVDG
jgi:hypothetical protein